MYLQMSDTDDRLVLSEVHIGSSALDEEAEMVSRYRYLTPSRNNDDSSSSSSSDSDAERSAGSDIKRRRKRPRGAASKAVMDRTSQRRSRPAHEVLTIVHRMATTLDLVGQQVWSAAFLLGDFVLTHEELFAGMQVRHPDCYCCATDCQYLYSYGYLWSWVCLRQCRDPRCMICCDL